MPEVNIPGVGVVHFPYDMPSDQIAAQAKRLHDEAQGKEPSLTRERQAPGTPSALDGHHPETLVGGRAGSREVFGKRVPSIFEISKDDLPSDAAFLKRGPEVGGAAGMVIGGPIGAGAGAALGSLAKGQQAQGAHVPTRGDLGGAALDGGFSALLSGAPAAVAKTAGVVGPAIAKNARPLSKTTSALLSNAASVASGNPLTGMGLGAATKALTSPGAIKGVGNAATRIGTMPSHAVNKAGFGALSAEAFRKALLDALEAEPSASAVP